MVLWMDAPQITVFLWEGEDPVAGLAARTNLPKHELRELEWLHVDDVDDVWGSNWPPLGADRVVLVGPIEYARAHGVGLMEWTWTPVISNKGAKTAQIPAPSDPWWDDADNVRRGRAWLRFQIAAVAADDDHQIDLTVHQLEGAPEMTWDPEQYTLRYNDGSTPWGRYRAKFLKDKNR